MLLFPVISREIALRVSQRFIAISIYRALDIFILCADSNANWGVILLRELYQSLPLSRALRNPRSRERAPIRSDVKPQCAAFPGWQEVNSL